MHFNSERSSLDRLNVRRYIVAAVVWGTSVFVLSLSVVSVTQLNDIKAILVFLYPWVALLIMTIGWLTDRRVSSIWPISGTLCGIYAIFLTGPAVFIYAPLAVPFALFLVVFHVGSRCSIPSR